MAEIGRKKVQLLKSLLEGFGGNKGQLSETTKANKQNYNTHDLNMDIEGKEREQVCCVDILSVGSQSVPGAHMVLLLTKNISKSGRKLNAEHKIAEVYFGFCPQLETPCLS